jgi:hypothetical protein
LTSSLATVDSTRDPQATSDLPSLGRPTFVTWPHRGGRRRMYLGVAGPSEASPGVPAHEQQPRTPFRSHAPGGRLAPTGLAPGGPGRHLLQRRPRTRLCSAINADSGAPVARSMPSRDSALPSY